MQTSGRPNVLLYLTLFAIQIAGVLIFVGQQLPEFKAVVDVPGRQLPRDAIADLMTAGVVCGMQAAYWYRLRKILLPFHRANMFLSHLFQFLGRLSFIFGSALFSVVVFRHLPAFGPDVDVLLAAYRGVILLGCLFALFCASLEMERLGRAFDSNRN